MTDALPMESIRVGFDNQALVDLRDRLDKSRLPAADSDGWERGTPTTWLRTLIDDWRAFDVGGFQTRLNQLSHLQIDVDGQSLHVVHAPGQGPNPLPVVLTHGWPGSFCEYLDLVPLLADPAAHGADAADAFSVVVPSLPGFGFSAPAPPGGFTADVVAGLWHRLMVDGLGYDRYAAHGSDLGAGVTAHLACLQPDHVVGIHLASPGLPAPPQPWNAAEQAYFDAGAEWAAREGGYAHEHATKPSTLGAGLHDSPAGLAAWIGEKVVAWSSTTDSGDPAFDRDLLLGTLTLYWVTETITSSLQPYWAYRHNPDSALRADAAPDVPTTVSIFRGERVPFPQPPRELAERYFQISEWHDHDRGGHFPAVAEPELLAQILRDAFRPLRHNT